MLKRIVVGSAIAAGSWAAYYAIRQWWATWGADPAEAARPLPGDDLVPVAQSTDTRGITIEAPPSAVWPWLVQMGYGRAGWYSYDRLDMRGRSADEIRPEWQGLAVGDLLPTDAGGGFVVRELEPERALVAFIDTDIAAAQRGTGGVDIPVAAAPGLAASGRFMGAAMPPTFAVSWSFVLEPLGSDRTRLIERVRLGIEGGSRGTRAMGPVLGFGVFVMMERQMRGIRERAERAAQPTVTPGIASAGATA
jgi:hypothetical protein